MRAGARPERLRHDALAPLLAAGDPALAWAVGHDVLEQRLDAQTLWQLPRVVQFGRSQNADGSWSYHGGSQRLRSQEDYAQLATYQRVLVLVSCYRLDRRHPMLAGAAEFLLSHQTAAGDIRGIYGAQYTPNYTADMLRLLIDAGYEDDPRVQRGMDWLLAMRQSDGGWAVPVRTATSIVLSRTLQLTSPVEPDRSRPSSHFVTGIVLRSFAAHAGYRHSSAARRAAELLAGRFFSPDVYPDHRDASFWTKLAFPFHWTDVVSSLDSIAVIGRKPGDAHVDDGVDWVLRHQRADGLWSCGYPNTPDPLADHWVTFAAIRMLKRLLGRHVVETRPRQTAPA